MTAEKSRIRQEAKRFRDQLQISPDWAGQAAKLFFQSVALPEGVMVSAYYPIGKEIDTSPIVEGCWARHVSVCLPCILEGRRDLEFAPWHRQSKLVGAGYQILEPEDKSTFVLPDIVLVPLLAFDQQGHRMGYGQGYYDLTLQNLRARKDILAVGLAYAEQAVLLALPTEPHDQKLDMVITPQRIFDFRA